MMYFPLRYTAAAKYPKLWFFDQLVLVDILMPVAATSYDARSLLLHLACIPFFVVSFMCIYEIGYFENDMKAARSEASPVLRNDVERFRDYGIEPYAWIFAGFFGAAGLGLFRYTELFANASILRYTTTWAAILIMVRVVFYNYNNRGVRERPMIYFVLQLLKYGSVLLVFRPTIFGVVITIAQIISISVVYWVYRAGGDQKSLNREVIRIALALGIGSLLGLSGARTGTDSLMAAVFAGTWLLARLGKPGIMLYLRRRGRTS
jgi:hypothetical protein